MTNPLKPVGLNDQDHTFCFFDSKSFLVKFFGKVVQNYKIQVSACKLFFSFASFCFAIIYLHDQINKKRPTPLRSSALSVRPHLE